MDSAERPQAPGQPAQVFATTHWSVVLAARGSDARSAHEAISRLCRVYWYPLYAYVRRRGHSPQDAEDLTQEFFLQLLEHDWVARADQSKGRFRSFLLVTLDRFLANQWDKARTRKRGGHLRQVPLVMCDAESRFCREPAETRTPEQEFERQWALAVLEHVLAGLREEYLQRGQAELFDTLKPTLIGSRTTQPYDRLGADLGMTEANVQTAVFRLRQRYRRRLLQEIARTVSSPDEMDSEVLHLRRVLAER